jgi:hypothetical protein
MAKERYQLLRGMNQNEQGTQNPGDIVESEVDLVATQGADRWRKVDKNFSPPASTPAAHAAENDGLEEMTVAELREYADENEIDLSGKSRKDEIVQAIREHLDKQ